MLGAIAAIVHLDGTRPDRSLLAQMAQAMACRTGAGMGIGEMRGASLLQGHAHGLPPRHPGQHPQGQALPLVHPGSGAILAFDGYLANAAQLRANLEARGTSVHQAAGDGGLMLAAHAIWGRQCALMAEGEFACVILDPARAQVIALRDHHGLRPLYFASDGKSGGRLIIASEIAAVMAALGRPPRANLPYLAEVALDHACSGDDTVWQGVHRVRPAHLLALNLAARSPVPEQSAYWRLDPQVALPLRSDGEYIEAYREALAGAVRGALPSAAPVAAEVSGGLDSSAVFAMAHHLLGQGEPLAPDLMGFALAGPPGTAADEIAHARAVGRFLGRPIRESDLFMPELGWFARQARADLDAPPWPNAAMSLGLERAAAQAGCEVLLTGIGGDQWLDGSTLYYRELLAAREWRRLARQWADDVRDRGWGATLALFARHGPGTFAPPAWRAAWRSARRRWRPSQPAVPPDDLAALLPQWRAALARREAAFEAALPAAHHASYKLRKLLHPRWSRVLDQVTRQRAHSGLEMRSPLLARSYIEFCAATPEHMRLRGLENKYLHRRALAGLLPETVLGRQSKAEFSLPYFVHDEALAKAFTDTLPAVLCALFDTSALGPLFERYLATNIDERYCHTVWGMYASGEVLRLSRGDDDKG